MKPAVFQAISLLFLAGCATTDDRPPRVVYQEVKIATPVYCVTAEQVPDEPPLIRDELNGNAAHDIGPVAISAMQLRKSLRIARALLLACVKP